MKNAAFTLVEILAVVAISSVLLVLAIPSLPSLLAVKGTTRAVSEISNLIEIARNEAMTMQCYTWLGFESATTSVGSDELRAVVISPLTGNITMESVSGSLLIASARPISPVYKWENLRLASLADLDASVRDLARTTETSIPLASQDSTVFRFGSAGTAQSRYLTITFTPQGYALLTASPDIMTPYVKLIDIGLIPSRGGSDQAALVINGFNGQTQILRR